MGVNILSYSQDILKERGVYKVYLLGGEILGGHLRILPSLGLIVGF